MSLPIPLAAAPLISDWISLSEPGCLDLRTGRVELGQGNLTALLQIAADELDLDPEQIRITGADTSLTPNEGFTSGSLSIAQGGMAIRLAASAARHLLLAEAATLLQCRPDELALARGTVEREGRAQPLTLWTLAETASFATPIVDWAAPKPPEARRVAGRPLPRIDLAERLTGTPFVHDLAPEGLLHGRAIHPPRMAAGEVSIDLEALRARPGVVAVLRDGAFLGLAAETEFAAVRAAQWAAARARWPAPGPAPSDPVVAIRESDEPLEVVHEAGDIALLSGLSSQCLTVTRPYLSHGSIGPSAALALWQDDVLEVWTHSQGVFPLRSALADVFGLAQEAISVHHRPGAGCYGHNGADDVALDAALIARAVPGRPVKVIWSRADEFQCAPLGPGMATTARAWLDTENRITGMEVTAASPPHGNRPGRNGAPNLRAAAYLAKPFPIPRSADVPLANGGGAERNAVPGYAIPNLRIAKRLVHGLPFRTSSLRSLGGFTNVLAIEALMDEIANDLGESPAVFRLRHLDDPRACAVIEAVVAAAGDPFAKPRPEGTGWGLGYARYKNSAAWCAVLLELEIEDEPRVTRVFAALDGGEIINPDGAINQTEGGILQAISWTLKEQVRFEADRVATASWLDYPILRFDEVPEISVRLIAHPFEPPLGCAEAAQGPTAAAVANALRDALGVRLNDLPLNRDAIIRALA
ncbi:xanthine dehydrogenase family protein molybdopterin-binding subunit [Solirhodobacter olei]|uniref:xanthine dehydrogenase family protein molybdopterin-binding subunit n=1 Tax=Solirhodobacter olei TaxID=2493082 RepID=UPI000FD866AC|nr:molybdopterin cofactor-binding domain-containing protein [Solirhodobacter olei]